MPENPLKFLRLNLDGLLLIEHLPQRDERGYFCRKYDSNSFQMAGLAFNWVQENTAHNSTIYTLRGLHFQAEPQAENKIFSVVRGQAMIAAVDIRKRSPTFRQVVSLTLSDDPVFSLFIPAGVALGYCTLTDNTTVGYKIDKIYSPEASRGIAWDDPDLGITWPTSNPILSIKDRNNMSLQEAFLTFI